MLLVSFFNVALSLDEQIPHIPDSLTKYLINSMQNSFFSTPVTHDEILDIVKNMKNTKAHVNLSLIHI